MIQEDYGVAASVGRELLSGKLGQAQRAPMRFSYEAVNHVVRVVEMSRHRAVRSDAEDARSLARARARVAQLNDAFALGGILLGVRDLHDGHPFVIELAKQLHDFFPLTGVQVSRRLIGE